MPKSGSDFIHEVARFSFPSRPFPLSLVSLRFSARKAGLCKAAQGIFPSEGLG
ncbi:hypothetical protein E2320_003239, partial [Naja naja]